MRTEIGGRAISNDRSARCAPRRRERIPGERALSNRGISLEVGDKQAAIDLVVVAENGVAIPELGRSVRRNVIRSIEQMTGLEVVEVNIRCC